MTPNERAHLLDELRKARDKALHHHLEAKRFHELRRGLMRTLIDGGASQADLARELGVTRQAVQKMLTI